MKPKIHEIIRDRALAEKHINLSRFYGAVCAWTGVLMFVGGMFITMLRQDSVDVSFYHVVGGLLILLGLHARERAEVIEALVSIGEDREKSRNTEG